MLIELRKTDAKLANLLNVNLFNGSSFHFFVVRSQKSSVDDLSLLI